MIVAAVVGGRPSSLVGRGRVRLVQASPIWRSRLLGSARPFQGPTRHGGSRACRELPGAWRRHHGADRHRSRRLIPARAGKAPDARPPARDGVALFPPPRGKLGDEEVVSHIVVRPRGGRPVGRDGAVTVWSFEKALYFSLEIIGGTTLTAPPGPFVGVFSCLCAPLDLKGSIRDD